MSDRYTWFTDPRMLAAGNARGISGGDSDAMPGSPTAGSIAGSGPDLAKLNGNLNAHAEALGISVEEIVAARRTRGQRRAPRPSVRRFIARIRAGLSR